MKKLWIMLGIMLVIIVVLFPKRTNQEVLWREESIREMKSSSKWPKNAYVLHLSDGSWVSVLMEHSCCTGAGFDCTVIKDSDGKIYLDQTYTFCGYEGLESTLNSLNANSLNDFYQKSNKLMKFKPID